MSLDFSRRFRNYTTSRTSIKKDEIDDIVYSLGGINKIFSYMTQAIINNPNICIYNGRLVIFSVSTKTDLDYPLLGHAKSLEEYKKVERKLLKTPLAEDILYRMEDFISDYKYILQKDLTYIQRNCSKKVLFFPVRLEHLKVYEDDFWEVGRHATFLFVEPQQRIGYFVDSNSYEWKSSSASEELGNSGLTRLDISKYITDKLEYILDKLLGMKIKIYTLDVIGPQKITSDKNCRYWSILLIELLSKYAGTPNFKPEEIIEKLKKKYNTKRKLDHLIKRYISYINSQVKNQNFWRALKV
jgi:hypothetical protein